MLICLIDKDMHLGKFNSHATRRVYKHGVLCSGEALPARQLLLPVSGNSFTMERRLCHGCTKRGPSGQAGISKRGESQDDRSPHF